MDKRALDLRSAINKFKKANPTDWLNLIND